MSEPLAMTIVGAVLAFVAGWCYESTVERGVTGPTLGKLLTILLFLTAGAFFSRGHL